MYRIKIHTGAPSSWTNLKLLYDGYKLNLCLDVMALPLLLMWKFNICDMKDHMQMA